MNDPTAPPRPGDASPTRGSSPIRAGTVIGRYVVISRLGSGGIGIVFSAYDPELDRKLALKLIRADKRTNTEIARSRLLREAQAMAKLHHPNVVTVHDVGTHDGAVFIAMEFVEGKTLRGWLNEASRSVPELLPIFGQVARGLQAAHAIGLVHRDVKPDNIMVGDDGRVRVMDFGLVRAQRSLHEGVPALDDARALEPEAVTEEQVAEQAMARVRGRLAGLGKLGRPPPGEVRTLAGTTADARAENPNANSTPIPDARDALDASLTKAGAVLGTPAYMAPEQVAGEAVDGRADQFALCVCLFEALHRERPFQGDTLQALVANIVQGRIAAPARPARLPRFLERVLTRGLRVRPDDRFADMGSFADALVPPRHRWRVGAGVCAVGLAAFGGAWAMRSDAPCSAPTGVQEIWTARQPEISAAFSALDLPYGEASFSATGQVLDDYVAAWHRSATDACEATRIRGTQSEGLLDRRVACLAQREAALDELVASLASPTAADVEHAYAAAVSLPPVAACDDTTALLAEVERPSDPDVARRVAELEDEVSRVTTTRILGHLEPAFARASALHQTAQDVGYAPLVAVVDLELGRIEERRGNYARAALLLRGAARTARAQRVDRVAAAAETDLVFVVGNRLGDPSEGRWWADQADAAVTRLTSGKALRARLTNLDGVLLFANGDRDEGLARLREAVQQYEGALGPAHPETLEAMHNVAFALRQADEFAQAEAMHREVLARRLAVLGPAHPQVGESLHAVANALLEQHDPAAGPMYDRAVALLEASLGADHPRTAGALLGRGAFRELEQNHVGASADFERALAIYTRELGPEHPRTVAARKNLARVGSAPVPR